MSLDGSFEAYEEEFQLLTSQIQRQLGSLGKAIDHDFLSRLFSQCDSLLMQMSIGMRNSNESEKEELLSRVRLYRIQLHVLKQQFRETGTEKMRGELGLSDTPDRTLKQNKHPEECLSKRTKLNKQNETLERARRTMADTEETAGMINEELHRSRSAIEQSHNNIAELSGLTNDASRILSRMKKRWF